MKISDFLSPEAVLINIRAADKQLLLQDLARRIGAIVGLPGDRIASELLKREELGSTGMGAGVAIPHARLQELKAPVGLLARIKPPIKFDAIDGQPVDLVFILLLPTAAEGEQLGALARVARKLRLADDLTKIRRAKSTSELYAALTT